MSGALGVPLEAGWSDTFLCRTQPVPGESLPGFLLRAEERNDFQTGECLRAVRRHGSGPAKLGRLGMLATANSLDLAKLAFFTGASLSSIEATTLVPISRWLYAGVTRQRIMPRAMYHRVCPACVAGRHIAFSTIFQDVVGCASHGLALVDRCVCPEAPLIEPFAGQDPFQCHAIGCARRYADLPQVVLTLQEQDGARARAGLYDQMRLHAQSADPLRPDQLRKGLEVILASALFTTAERRHYRPLIRQARSAPLNSIVAVLRAAGASPADLDDAAREPDVKRQVVSRDSADISPLAACPSPPCGKRSLLVRKHPEGPGGEVESQCTSCGTRATPSRVLFSFDPAPGYEPRRAAANSSRLLALHTKISSVCAEWPDGVRLSRRAAFIKAGVPLSIAYDTPRAGLAAVVAAAARGGSAHL